VAIALTSLYNFLMVFVKLESESDWSAIH